MKRLILAACCAGLVLAGGGSDLAAQGGILEFLHKLSGPQFIGAGVTIPYPLDRIGEQHRFRARLSLIDHWSIREEGEVTPVTNISMNTVQLTGEFLLDYFDFNAGLAMHRFSNDEFEAFWHPSFPVQVAYRLRLDALCSGRRFCLVPRLGAGVHVFPAFADSDFAPLDVTVFRDDPEAVLTFFVSLEVRY